MAGNSKQVPGHVTIVPTGACYDCGGRCLHKIHVKNGVAVRVETDDGEEPQLRSCLRGRALRQHLYSPIRLLCPLKRVGRRGEGKFERISWDDALDTVAGEIRRITETYGPQAVLAMTGSGPTPGWYAIMQIFQGYRTIFGGRPLKLWGELSSEGSVFAARATYGTLTNANSRDDLKNSRLIILWGIDPAVSIFATNTSYYLAQAKEAGAKFISIDPKYTDTAASVGARWIPIKPGTDAAMAVAVAYVIIAENLQDQGFLDKYTAGFDKFKDYVLGVEDGTPKTAEWAEAKTGVPAAAIVAIAREYATTKPAALIAGTAPGRTAYGEQYHRAVATLAAMTGNIGIHGGDAAGFHRGPVGAQLPADHGRQTITPEMFDVPARLRKDIHTAHVWETILKGKAGGFPGDVKLLYVCGDNPLNQIPNINKGIEALKKPEFVVVHDQFPTATARFADILLPVSMIWERDDYARPWMSGPYFLAVNKVVEPLGETRADQDIFCELAKRLGYSNPALDEPRDEGMRKLMESGGDMAEPLSNYAVFREQGVYKMKLSGPKVCFEKQIADPEHNPFPTSSGKIEIYSQHLANLHNPEIPAIPKYIPTWEGPDDPLIEQYPLQLITIHHKTRAHSNFDNVPWLKEIEPQSVLINTQDAEARGIKDGDIARVFNDRGETIIRSKVTERIMPGVVSLGEGAWYSPDEKGRDRAGSPNILLRDRYSPGGAFAANTCLVQVRRFVDD